jgi:predicted Zn-dependent peptidase
MWMIATEVGKDVTEAAINEIYKEIDILSKEPVSDAELETVKNYILGNFIKSIDGPFNQSEKIKTIVLRNLEEDFYQNHIKKILSITANDIQKTVNNYFTKDKLVELVVGGK